MIKIKNENKIILTTKEEKNKKQTISNEIENFIIKLGELNEDNEKEEECLKELNEICNRINKYISNNNSHFSNDILLFQKHNLYFPILNLILTSTFTSIIFSNSNTAFLEERLLIFLSFLVNIIKTNDLFLYKYLSTSNYFIKFIFKCLLYSKCFNISMTIIESLCLYGEKDISIIDSIGYFLIYDIYIKYKNQNFLGLCRLFSCLVFDNNQNIHDFLEEEKTSGIYNNCVVLYNLPSFINDLLKNLYMKIDNTRSYQSYFSSFDLIRNLYLNRINSMSSSIGITDIVQSNLNVNMNINSNIDNIILENQNNENEKEVNSNLNLEQFKINLNENINDVIIDIYEYIKGLSNSLFSNNYLIKILSFRIFDTKTTKSPKKTDNLFNKFKKISSVIKTNLKDYSLNPIHQLSHLPKTSIAEILYILSNILESYKHVKFQNEVMSSELINQIISIFQIVEWGNIFKNSNDIRFQDNEELLLNLHNPIGYHGNGCKCEKDNSIKIQLLRFVYYSFTKESNIMKNKIKLLSEEEMRTLLIDESYLSMFIENINRKYCGYDNDHKPIDNGNSNDNDNDYYDNDLIMKAVQFFNIPYDLYKKYHKALKNDEKNKEKLFTKNEIDEKNQLSFLELKLKSIYTENNKNNNTKSTTNGLLSYLILTFMCECKYSASKYWLSACLETIIRGNNPFLQYYLVSFGLCEYVLYEIIYIKQEYLDKTTENSQNKNSLLFLQIYFDLLAELVKYNPYILHRLSDCLVDKNERNEFEGRVVSIETIIDSNVFIRSVYLTMSMIEKKRMSVRKELDETLNYSEIERIILNNESTIFLNLINQKVISYNKITQTNISCINTALIILICKSDFLYKTHSSSEALPKNNVLKEFLKKVKSLDKQDSLLNFYDLLKKWTVFYYSKPSDAESLEFMTQIRFSLFKKMVSYLMYSNDDVGLLNDYEE